MKIWISTENFKNLLDKELFTTVKNNTSISIKRIFCILLHSYEMKKISHDKIVAFQEKKNLITLIAGNLYIKYVCTVWIKILPPPKLL